MNFCRIDFICIQFFEWIPFIKFENMLKVVGHDQFNQLILTPNKIGAAKNAIISPAQDSKLTVSSLLSFSVFCYHSVWITNDGKAHAIGSNYGQIWRTLPLGQLKKPVEFEISDANTTYELQSAVCGWDYTLYLTFPKPSIPAQLVYARKGKNGGNPLFIRLVDTHPVQIYGGRKTISCINEDGSVTVISPNLFDEVNAVPYNNYLPNNEKAIDSACCDEWIYALSASGRIYQSKLSSEIEIICDFQLVPELRDLRFVKVSGTYNHCLAITDDGLVYGIGSNYNGQLGIPKKELKDETKFALIRSLQNYRIVSCSAGFSHSLFISDDGKLFGCGLNSYGQLFLKSPTNKNYEIPELTTVDSDCTFAIAGDSLSCCFVGCTPPVFSPNQPLNQEILMGIVTKKKKQIEPQKVLAPDEEARREELIQEMEQLEKQNESMKAASMKMKDTLKRMQSDNQEKKQKLDSSLKNLKGQKQELLGELSLMQSERKDLSKYITNLNFNLEDSISKFNLVRAQKDEILSEIQLLTRKRDQLDFDNESLIKTRTELVKEMNNVQKESDQLTVDYETIKLKHHNLSEVVASLEQSKSKLKKRILSLTTQKDNLKSQIASFKSEYDNLLTEYGKAQENQKELKEDIEDLTKKKSLLLKSIKENDDLQKEHEELETSIHVLRKEHNELSKGIEEMKLQHEELVNSIRKLRKEKENYQKTNSTELVKETSVNPKVNNQNSRLVKIRSKTFEYTD